MTVLRIAFVLGVTLLTSGCISTLNNVQIRTPSNMYTSENAGNQGYREVGVVSASGWGGIFSSCNDLAQEAVNELLLEAAEIGGNGVINLRWGGQGGSVTDSCETNYGWLWLPPLFLIFGTSVDVTGTAVILEAIKTTQ